MEAGLIGLLLSWCPTAVSSILIFLVSYLIRKTNTDAKEAEARTANLQKEAEVRAANLRREISQIHTDLNITLNKLYDRLSLVEKEYVEKEFFFRELQGWRSEINRVSDKITDCFSSLHQNIFQLLGRGKDNG